jgi:hypothetical protein
MKTKSFKYLSFFALFMLLHTVVSVQGQVDAGLPVNPKFQTGENIAGSLQNSINEVTGKVTFALPITSISSGSVSFAINLNYNGQSAFKEGKEQNQFSPTSVVGVGWTLPIPKIIVDHKRSAVRDDDVFYYVEGESTSVLHCFNKEATYWEFQTEVYNNWKIRLNLATDSWEVTKDDGIKYIFGTGTTKDLISVWNNWIGDSNQTPTGTQGLEWNLAKIEDQWNNHISFSYTSIMQGQHSSQVLHKHTEASYLDEIVSSYGQKIKFNYGNKALEEYVEPNRENAEPDAYQEQYEKKFLQSIDAYNTDNVKITTYALGHTLHGTTLNRKRYFTSLTQSSYEGGHPVALPAQLFEYHTSGTFKGGLHRVTYPSGGIVTYNYQNKFLFNNFDKVIPSPLTSSGYRYYGSITKDNYSLYVTRTINPVSGNKHRFKFFRYTWDGKQWNSNEYTFPHLIEDYYPNESSQGELLMDFQAVFGDDYYGFVYDKGTNADMYLFHKEKNGSTWHSYTHTNLPIGNDDPIFMQGDDFISLASFRTGKLNIYTWNGSTWNYKYFNQGNGQFYMSAGNNYIMSLDVDGGFDEITGVNQDDLYYFYYLDAEKRWHSKSWTSVANANIVSNMSEEGKFFPDASIMGFVADQNPEVFLRWNNDYNLTHVDNIFGGHPDRFDMQPIANSLFSLIWPSGNYIYYTARFNGVNWASTSFLPQADYGSANFGLDFIAYYSVEDDEFRHHQYSANAHTWLDELGYAAPWYSNIYGNGVTADFIISGKKIFKRTYLGPPSFPTQLIGTLQYDTDFVYTNSSSHAYVETSNNAGIRQKRLLNMNKENGLLINRDLGSQVYMRSRSYIGGSNPFMSPKTVWLRNGNNFSTGAFTAYLYRIIEDNIDQSVYDIVVGSIEYNDQNAGTRRIDYTYNNPTPETDNRITYYGEVIVNNRGFGSNSIGTIKTTYNTGATDVQMTGLALVKSVLDASGNLKSQKTTTWQKFTKNIFNGSQQVNMRHYILPTSEREQLFFGFDDVETTTTYTYNFLGQLKTKTTTNSKGQTEREEITYAHEQFIFMGEANMLMQGYRISQLLDNNMIGMTQDNWVNVGGKRYVDQQFAGPNASSLRLASETTNIDGFGNVLEASNGNGIYATALHGYGNLHEVASISNTRYTDVVNQLDVTYAQLQNLNTADLKVELLKLYDRLPNAMISLVFYNADGQPINSINERREETYIFYDVQGRVDYITDGNGKILEQNEYNFGN